MIDIHCHPLPAVDDGAKTLEVAVEMCRMAAADGTTHLVATPHSNYRYTFDVAASRAKLAELQQSVGDSPRLLLGCDFHLSYDNIQMLREGSLDYTINGTQYLLVEFGEHFIADQLDRVFYEIDCLGLTSILTHPERNPVFQRRPDLLYHWVSRGCLAQITAKSYTGGFGRTAQHFAEKWLEQNLVHFFASDAHDTQFRPPILSECRAKLVKTCGEETADRLLTLNPQAVIEGRPLPPGPEPVGPGEAKPKKGWFSFLRR